MPSGANAVPGGTVVVIAAAALVVLFVRPLTPTLALWTVLSAALAILLLGLLRKPPVDAQ